MRERAHDVEGTQGAAATEHERSAPKCVAGLAQEVELVLQGQIWAFVVCQSLQVVLHLLYVFPDRLRNDWKVLMQLAAEHQQKADVKKCVKDACYRSASITKKRTPCPWS